MKGNEGNLRGFFLGNNILNLPAFEDVVCCMLYVDNSDVIFSNIKYYKKYI